MSGGGGGDELSLRPTTSMMLKPKTPGILPASAQGGFGPSPSSQDPPPVQAPKSAPTILHKDPPLLIKPAAEKTKGGKKDRFGKGPSKDEWMSRVRDLLESLFNEQSVDQTVVNYKDLKVPDKFGVDVTQLILTTLLKKGGKYYC